MNFNISDSTRIANDKRVICDYYDCSIYFNQYASTRNNGRHIKMPFFTPKNIVKPNGIYISGEPIIKFMSSDLYIYKKTHNIAGINYDGELIIKNKQITNGDRKLYVCFPLKTDNRNSKQANEIDKIIDQSEKVNNDSFSMPVNLNNMFDKLQKYIFYESGNDIIIVFTQPIKVKTNFDKFAECDLFPKYSDNYNILENVSGKDGFQSMTEGFVEGIDDDGMTCYPIDNNGEPLTDVPSLVKVNSGSEAQNKTINLLFAMIMFVVVFSFSFFGVPPLYKEIFINESKLNDTTLTYTTLFCGFYLAWCIAMMCGMIVDDTACAITGIFFSLLFAISLITIIGRTYVDTEYFPGEPAFKFDIQLVKNSAIFVKDHYLNNFISLLIDKKNPYSSPQKWGHIFEAFILLLTIIMFVLVATKIIKPKNKDYAYSLLGIFGLVYTIILAGPFVGFVMAPS
jgi:DNA-binding cell septation regulator SpoVG